MLRLCWFLLTVPVLAQIQLIAPKEVSQGAPFEISWTGPQEAREFVTIVEKGTPEGKYEAYGYASNGPWKTVAPDTPGEYEIRYLASKSPYTTLARVPLIVTPVTVELSAPDVVKAGSEVQIHFKGTLNPKDFITIVETGTPDRKYKKYKYTNAGSPAKIEAPDAAGDYEIRYLSGQEYRTLAMRLLKVEAAHAELTVPPTIGAGSAIEVSWKGPSNRGDFITVVEVGTKEGKYGKYAYTERGNPLQIPAPETAGDYEVRYVTGGERLTLASAPIRVISVKASLTFTPEVEAGSELEIAWTGPDNRGDFITIVEAGAKPRDYGRYRYTSLGSPVRIQVPEVPGSYEIRYLTAREYRTLAAEPLQIKSVNASLKGPDTATARSTFSVEWSGPDHRGDFIAVAPVGSDSKTWPSYAYTARGNPLQVVSPKEPGDYELRYQTGRQYIVLATQRIRIEPAALLPGRLTVVSSETAMSRHNGVEVILDASGSMLKKMDGRRRIDIAKTVLADLAEQHLPAATPFALRVFGHREADSCRTDLEIPLSPLNAGNVKRKIAGIEAMNLAKTPIADSLLLVAEDMAAVNGERLVILITDGEETCGGEPAEAIENLKQQGIDVRVNIVGFGIDEEALKQTFRFWAETGGGDYYDAKNAEDLGASLVRAVQVPFRVLDQAGEVVARGLVNGDELELMPGEYTVESVQSQPRRAQVTIEADTPKTLSLEP